MKYLDSRKNLPMPSSFSAIRMLLVGLLTVASSGVSAAELTVADLFTDHMVMQRRVAVPVWGWSNPGETVHVAITGQDKQAVEKQAVADATGKWLVRLDPLEAGTPRTMTITGSSTTLTIHDILLGEVWLCSGQSNMEWALTKSKDADQALASADLPDIRLFNLVRGGANRAKGGPAERLPPSMQGTKPYAETWQLCSPASAKDNLSAVAFYFARDLFADLHVPIGLIINPVGGSAIQSWISRTAFEADPDLKSVTAYFDRQAEFVTTPAGQTQLAERTAAYAVKAKAALATGKPLWPSQYPVPVKDGFTSMWFNSRVNPLIPFAIKGVLWYQGEANTYARDDTKGEYPAEYCGLLPLLIRDWRSRWGQGDFPFLYVQLPWWGSVINDPNAGGGGWCALREIELKALSSIANTGMAVTIDVGDSSIHPLNKQPVGARLTLAARKVAYNEPIVASGPLYSGMQIDGTTIRISFTSVGGGLVARDGDLKQFSIAGADGRFVWAAARIDGATVVVSSPAVPAPTMVRYAWQTNPQGCNLFNQEGLPASPFRTDEPPLPPLGAYYQRKLQAPAGLAPVN